MMRVRRTKPSATVVAHNDQRAPKCAFSKKSEWSALRREGGSAGTDVSEAGHRNLGLDLIAI